MKINRFLQLVLVAIAFAMLGAPARAQMSTQPFNFGGGLGMSEAGRAAILNQQINGTAPEVLLKDDQGRPLGVTQGPGGTAVVTGPSGELLPGYRGKGWKRARSGLAAGAFDEFFVEGQGSGAPFAAASTSGATVEAWTEAVHGHPQGYGNSVDQWTAMTYYLRDR